MENRILKILIRRLAEFIIFLLILILLNLAITYWDIVILKDPISFITQSVPFIGLIALIMLFGEIFSILKFPFNLPYPLFNALGISLIVYFIFEVFSYIIRFGNLDLQIPLDLIFLVILILVIMIVIITGYYGILSDFYKKQKREQPIEVKEEKPKKKPKKIVKKKVKK